MYKRKNLYFVFISLNLCLVLITPAQAMLSVKDDKGNIVTLQQPAKRIISLAPHITESLFAVAGGDKIIGAVSYSDYPEEAKLIPRVGGYPSLDIEKIVFLKPDLVIAWTHNNLNQVTKLKSLGLTVFISDPKHPGDVAKTLRRFGVLTGTTSTANKVADNYINQYIKLKNRFSNREKVKVFYQIWNKPLMTVGGQHLISDIINLCGGVNVFSEIKTLTPKISVESVIASEAEVIIAGGMGEKNPEWLTEWKSWNKLPAVEKEQLYFINPDILQRVGPRILQGAEELCELLDNTRK